MTRLPFTLSFAGLMLAGCAGYGPGALKPGASVAEATQTMGAPTGRYALASGERLEFARGPAGLHTYMLDFDAQGRLLKAEQVLNEPHFNTIPTGITREEVLKELGRPSNVSTIHYQKRQLWSWRYDSVFCQWFQVSLDTQNKVVDTGYAPDPRCEVYDADR